MFARLRFFLQTCFSIFINGLAKGITDMNVGVPIVGEQISILLCTVDIDLLGEIT